MSPICIGFSLRSSFSALQRAEIAEILVPTQFEERIRGFSALQRAEIAEIVIDIRSFLLLLSRFSALQRAEIAEMRRSVRNRRASLRRFQCSSTSRNC